MTLAVTCSDNYSLESLIKLLIRDADCEPYVECDTREGMEALVKQLFSVLEDGTLALNVCECDSPEPPVELAFKMVFDDIANASTMISGDANDVVDWNTFFDLPTNGTPFTSVTVTNNTVELFGGANIKLRDYVFGDNIPISTSILEINDLAECVIECGEGVFSDYNTGPGCYALTKVHLTACAIIGINAFADCETLADLELDFNNITTLGYSTFNYCPALTAPLSFPALTSIGDSCFESDEGLTTFSAPLITTIGDSSFNSCSDLTSVNFVGLISLGPSALAGCIGLTNINLENATSIGAGGLSGCTGLTTIDLSSCADLGGTSGFNNVFNGITGNIITITIPHALETDGDIVYLKANNTVTVLYSD